MAEKPDEQLPTDAERLEALEHKCSNLQSEMDHLKLVIRELTTRSNLRHEAMKAAVNDAKHSIDLIYRNVVVPKTNHILGIRCNID